MKLQNEHIQEIKTRFEKIQTVEELASLLSWIYSLKFPNRNKKTEIFIEEKHLNYYAFKPTNRYNQFTIKKKNGGERPISAPRYKLKTIQKCLNEILNAVFTPHFAATGFVIGKSIVDNAKKHIGKKFVFNTDLKDFFPSTKFRRIKSVLCFPPFNLTDNNGTNPNELKKEISEKKGREHLGFLIANLCCGDGCLPQGAPTSPTLTNLVCQRLDKKLYKLAKKLNATYSRYADDITFSANKPVFDEKFKNALKSIVEEEQYKINFEKERLQNNKERQSVTGIVVNKKSNVDRNFIKDIRFWLMCWNKYNLQATQQKFEEKFPEKKGFLRYEGATPQFYNYLKGKILFFRMVRGMKDEMFLKFKKEYDILSIKNKLNSFADEETDNKKNHSNNLRDLGDILNIWENEGFESAMTKYQP